MTVLTLKETLDLEITTKGMAEYLGVHVRTLQQLDSEGWIDGRVGRNCWNVVETTRSYLTHILLEARMPAGTVRHGA